MEVQCPKNFHYGSDMRNFIIKVFLFTTDCENSYAIIGGDIVQICYFVKKGDEKLMLFRKFRSPQSFFSFPVKSSNLGYTVVVGKRGFWGSFLYHRNFSSKS
jgi:hypothetical protein